MKKKYVFLILLIIVIIYLIPAPQPNFFKSYTKDDKPSQSLRAFKLKATKEIEIDGIKWEYYVGGSGTKTILFLHGMGGAYDLWWQQVTEFEKDFKIISYTLPEEINSLENTAKGILKILETEQVDTFYAVGTSMGGYISQYLVKTIPNRIEKAVFGNTFPPNNLIAKENEGKSKLMPWLPEILISKLGEKKLNEEIVPAAKNNELLKAFMPSLPFSKKQFINRYYVVIDMFTANPAKYEAKRIPKLIIESDNDPLIKPELRKEIKELYNDAEVYTFQEEGHFPNVTAPNEYNKIIRNFLDKENEYPSVEKTIKNYFEGRTNADINKLKNAFSTNASLYATQNNEELIMPFNTYLIKVQTDGIQKVNTKILEGSITGNIANFNTEFIYSDKSYIDYLTLVKTQNGWKIISKTFTQIK